MNEEDKIAWIEEENKIVSFHIIDNGKRIRKNRKPVFSIWTDKLRIPNDVKGNGFDMKRIIARLPAADMWIRTR